MRTRVSVFLVHIISKRRGPDFANAWLWNCTCFPFGPLSDGMLWDGFLLWDGYRNLNESMARAEATSEVAWTAIR